MEERVKFHDYSRLQGAGRVYLSAIAVATLQLVGVVTIRGGYATNADVSWERVGR